MNLLVELSNGDVEEVEVPDTELLYDAFWGDMDSMAEARDILLTVHEKCSAITQDLSELRTFVRGKFEATDDAAHRFYELTSEINTKVRVLREQVAADRVRSEQVSTKVNILMAMTGFASGAFITAVLASFL